MLLIIVLYSYLFIMAKTTIQYIKTPDNIFQMYQSPILSLILFIYLFIHSFIHSFSQSFIHKLMYIHSFILHSSIQYPSHPHFIQYIL